MEIKSRNFTQELNRKMGRIKKTEEDEKDLLDEDTEEEKSEEDSDELESEEEDSKETDDDLPKENSQHEYFGDGEKFLANQKKEGEVIKNKFVSSKLPPAKESITFYLNDHSVKTRTFSLKDHGEDFQKIAEEFHGSNENKVLKRVHK